MYEKIKEMHCINQEDTKRSQNGDLKIKLIIFSLDQRTKLDPNNGEAWKNKGDALHKLGRYEEELEW